MASKKTSLEQIDAETATLRGKIKGWQEELNAKKSFIDAQEAKRADLRHRALSDGDAKSKAALDDLRLSIITATEEAADFDNEIRDATAEIERMLVKREDAQLEKFRQELIAAYEELETFIASNPEPLTVAFCRDTWIPFCNLVRDRRAKLGFIDAGGIPDHLPVKYYQASFWDLFPAGYVTKPHGKYVGKSFPQLFREHRQDFTGEKSNAASETQVNGKAPQVNQAEYQPVT